MRFSNVLTAMILVLTPMALAEVPPAVDDSAITARIETMYLLNQHLNPFNINTTTNGGVVTITGGVNDVVQKELAEELADSVEGVKSVTNNITVVPTTLGEKERRSWKQRIEDKTITTSVRSRLLYHRQFKGLTIGVGCVKGVVTLSGIVGTDAQRDLIGEVARDTRAVEGVINNLIVRTREEAGVLEYVGQQFSDEWMESRVETSILLNRHLSIRELDVEVNDGICILTGSVASEEKRSLAGDVAANIQGVNQVDNQITVRTGEEEVVPGTRPRSTLGTEEESTLAAPSTPAPKPTPEPQPEMPAPESNPPADDLLEPLNPRPRVESSTLAAP